MPRHYVYYRVLEQHVEAVAAVVRRWPGVELLRRPGSKDGLVTLMEVFDAGFESTGLEALAGYVVGERHLEVFERLD